MAFKDLWELIRKNEYQKKLTFLENDLKDLKLTLNSLKDQLHQSAEADKKDPPIIIEKVNIEKIVLDKYELNNNFGQLGIKELKGKLNIGATYGTEFTPEFKDENNKEDLTQTSKNKAASTQGPIVNIKAKEENT